MTIATKSLKHKIEEQQSGLLFYSFAPPKITTEKEKLHAIAAKQIERLEQLFIDGIILYDIQDESHRTSEARTFPYIPTLAPETYSREYLSALQAPKIIYKSIAHHSRETFQQWLGRNKDLEYAVLVGASSQKQTEETGCSLNDAYDLHAASGQGILLGGVTIPERHAKKGDEHLRIQAKMQKGCQYFISQCVYNIHDTKNLLSDCFYSSPDGGAVTAPLIFTLSPCGSLKTLEFMQWLGVEVPKWLYNDLKHAPDILASSVAVSLHIAAEIIDFAASKKIPVGFNIESVSNKKAEIEASVEMLQQVSGLLQKNTGHLLNTPVAEAAPTELATY